MGSVLLGARVILAGVFAVAGVAKLLDQTGSQRSLVGFGVPRAVVPALAPLLPVAELAAAAALIPRDTARWGALASVLLLLCFVTAIGVAMRGAGPAPNCHCFGQLSSAPAGWSTLTRNALLAALAAIVVLEGPGPSLGDWVSERTAAELVAVALGAAVSVLLVSVYRLWRDREANAAELAALHEKLADLPVGLPVGASAPEFALPDLDGQVVTLSSLSARGRPVALVFVSPTCGPCSDLFPELGRWQSTLADRLTVAVVTDGTVLDNIPIARQHGISMLLQAEMEVMEAYKVSATPCALIVSSQGTIASHAVGSRVAIEPLIRLAMNRALNGSGTSARAVIEPPAA